MMQEVEDYTHLPEENLDRPRRRRGESKGGLETRREYYWILAVDKSSGRPLILGAYDTEEEANQVGFQKIDSGNFEVVPLRTRNVQRANRILKYRRFHQTERLEEGLKRAKHEAGLDQDARRASHEGIE